MKVMIVQFIHVLPSITKVSGTKVMQKICIFAYILTLSLVNLL